MKGAFEELGNPEKHTKILSSLGASSSYPSAERTPLAGEVMKRARIDHAPADLLALASLGRKKMKFYNSIGPNPRAVRMFMAEKGFEVPKVEVDLLGEEPPRRPTSRSIRRASARALELNDGSCWPRSPRSASTSTRSRRIRRRLIGDTAEERAKTRMWVRRVDLNIVEPAPQRLPLRRGPQALPEPDPRTPRRPTI